MATNPILYQIIELVPGSPYTARYKKHPADEKPAGCLIPDDPHSSLVLDDPPAINISDNCQFDFNPIPINVIPFIPPIADVTVPCPDGYTVSLVISEMKRSGTVVQVTVEGIHNLAVGESFQITNVEQEAYNGTHTVSRLNSSDPSYLEWIIASSPTSPATPKEGKEMLLLSPKGASICFKINDQPITSVPSPNASYNTSNVGFTDSCSLNFGGCVNLAIPELFCLNGFGYGGNIVFKVNGQDITELPNAVNTITLNQRGDDCGGDISGEINIPILTWCAEGVKVEGSAKIKAKNYHTGQYEPLMKPGQPLVPQEIKLVINEASPCTITLEGEYDLDIPNWVCTNGLQFGGSIGVVINGQPYDQNHPISFTNITDCGADLQGTLELEIPSLCPGGLQFQGGIQVVTRNAQGHEVDPVSNTVALSKNNDGCGATLGGKIVLDIPQVYCTEGFQVGGSVEFQLNGRAPSSGPQTISMYSTDDNKCSSTLIGGTNSVISFNNVPIYSGYWLPYVPYFPYDIVSTVDEDEEGNKTTCTWMSLTSNISKDPRDEANVNHWRILGCDGGTPGGSDLKLYLITAVKSDWLEGKLCTINTSGKAEEVPGTPTVQIAKPLDFQKVFTKDTEVDGLYIEFPWLGCGDAPTNQRDWTCQRRKVSRKNQSAYTSNCTNNTDLQDSWPKKDNYDAANPATLVSWYQEIWPPYVPNVSVVAAMQLASGYALNLPAEGDKPAVQLKLVDINITGRTWLDCNMEIEGCFGGVQGYISVRGTAPYQKSV